MSGSDKSSRERYFGDNVPPGNYVLINTFCPACKFRMCHLMTRGVAAPMKRCKWCGNKDVKHIAMTGDD